MTVTPDEAREQLAHLLASDAFATSARLSRFLRYVVERTLSGEADRLKEYSVGVDVFDRPEGFDPRLDSLVRVEAGRLRAKLTEYYAGAGAADPVIVRMPRGSYAPVFERRVTVTAPEAVAASAPPPRARVAVRRRALPAAALAAGLAAAAILAWRSGLVAADRDPARPVVIAVLPFAHYSASEEALAALLTDGVTSELARTGELGVVSHTSALQFAGVRRPLKEIARALGADVVMEGTVAMDGERVHLRTVLVDAHRDRKFRVDDFAGVASDLGELQARVAAAVAAALRPRRG